LTRADVFVIGGGPAGLAAAIAARQKGFDVLVADGAVPPIDKACGEGVMPDGVAAAQALGLDLAPAGQPFRGIEFVGGADCRPSAGRDQGVPRGPGGPPYIAADFPNGHGLGVRRTALHRIMLERAESLGVRFAWGTRVTSLESIDARWIVGADGSQSPVRKWAGLDACVRDSRRFGFRRHYRVAPWSEYMQIHWGGDCQMYVTPVGPEEVCAVLISRDPRQRLDDALPQFPELAARLRSAASVTAERGGVTASRRLKAVCRGNVALVGDASGSVDAITGEGLCLLFQHAVALADALEAGDLTGYATEHRRIGRRPEFMADLMLMLDGRAGLRARTLRAMAARPSLFAGMLAMHVGEVSKFEFFRNGLALGWQMLNS
jgi:menaquinone-9 beta-reductase